jgi:predicted metal-dependent phosphoesterase TrpH
MRKFNLNKIEGLIDGKLDFRDFAWEMLIKDIYADFCERYLTRRGSLRERLNNCDRLYHDMFKITLRMNQLCPVYDTGFINHIAREAIALNGEAWQGVSENELHDLLLQRINRCTADNHVDTDISEWQKFAIDCHVHTSNGSNCAVHSRRDMVETAISNGLDAIIITEHDRLTPQDEIDKLNKAYAPFRVFSGIEIRIAGDDFLVLGIHDEILEKKKWDYIELHRFVRERGGYLALAHPMRYWDGVDANVYSYRPDAVELYSVNMDNMRWEARQNALRLANTLQAHYIANSDAHAKDAFRYCNVLDKTPDDESEMISYLKRGYYRLGRVPVIK